MRKIIAILISTSCVGCASTEKYIDNFITLNNNNRQNILHEKENHYNSLLQKLKKSNCEVTYNKLSNSILDPQKQKKIGSYYLILNFDNCENFKCTVATFDNNISYLEKLIGECDAERIKDEEKKSEIAKENEIAAKKQDEEIMGNNTPKTLAKFIEGKCTALVNMYTSGNINYYGNYLSLNER